MTYLVPVRTLVLSPPRRRAEGPRRPGRRRLGVRLLPGLAPFQWLARPGAVPGLAKSYTGTARNITAAASGTITLSGVTEVGGKIAGTLAFHAPLAGTRRRRGRSP